MDVMQASRNLTSSATTSPLRCATAAAPNALDAPAPTQADVFAGESSAKLDAWLMKGGDCPRLEDSWVRPMSVSCMHRVAVSPDGMQAFAVDNQGNVSAVDPATGDSRWSQKLGPVAGDPAVAPDGSAVVVVTSKGTVFSLDPATGDKKWETSMSFDCRDGAVIGRDGSVCLVTGDQRICRLDPKDGHVIFSSHLGKDVARGPVVASDGAVFVTDWDLQMHALNPDGSERWVLKGKATATTFVVGSDDTIYIGRDYGAISAVDPATGQERWTVVPAVGGSLDNMRPILTVADAPTASPSQAGGSEPHAHLYASCDGGYVYSLDARNGSLEWTSRQDRGSRPAPVVMPDGTVAAPCGDYNVYGLDPSSGTVLWKWPQPHKGMPRATADAQGRLYCRSDDGNVRMADPALRFEQAARAMAEAQATSSPATGEGAPPAPASVQVEDSWVVIGGVRIPRRG